MPAGWLESLNQAQKDAVTHGDGPLLVVAGAGTGKTKTLACRVAWLIEQGVPPDRILLLTFSRRAAAEMLQRAAGLTAKQQGGAAGKVWGGTFHAVANRLLRMYGRALGLPAEFTVMDQSDAADMMNLVRNDLGLAKGDRRFPRKETLASIYSRTVNAQAKLSDVLRRHFPWCQDAAEGIKSIFQRYTELKRRQGVVDYDDLLLLWSALCAAPGLGDMVAERFQHILVDEYQDTNAVQADILHGMRRRIPHLMAVGDDAQSIYSFRAATVRNILDFATRFPGARTVTLEQNYRSTQPLLAVSNAVMTQARQRHPKNLWSQRPSDQKPLLVTCADEAQQCDAVCRNVLAHLEQGIPLMHQAVLFRTGHHSDQLEVELSRRNIPFVKYGGLKFVESGHIKDLLAFLRILENPHDEISWFRVLQLLDGIGPASAQRILESLGVRAASTGDQTLASPLHRLLDEPPRVPPAAKPQFDQLRQVVTDCLGQREPEIRNPKSEIGRSVTPLTTQIQRLRAFYEPIFERRYDNASVRLRDIEQLEHIAAGYTSRSQFLADITLDPPAAASDLAVPPYLEEDYLILSTIHSAKGCEWDVVHVIHAADGMIPSDMAVTDEEGVDEERRLFYVALTRAKDWLYVYFPFRYYNPMRPHSDAHIYAQLTRFITREVRTLFEQRTESVAAAAVPVAAGPSDWRGVEAWVNRLWES